MSGGNHMSWRRLTDSGMQYHPKVFLFLVVSVCLLVVFSLSLQTGRLGEVSNSGILLASSYWSGFWEYWRGLFKKQDSIVMFVLGVGVVSILIITRGKWRK